MLQSAVTGPDLCFIHIQESHLRLARTVNFALLRSKLPKSTEVRSHGNNVRDVIIAHVISADAQIYIYIPTDVETAN